MAAQVVPYDINDDKPYARISGSVSMSDGYATDLAAYLKPGYAQLMLNRTAEAVWRHNKKDFSRKLWFHAKATLGRAPMWSDELRLVIYSVEGDGRLFEFVRADRPGLIEYHFQCTFRFYVNDVEVDCNNYGGVVQEQETENN